jgi:hypothetical protein
MYRYFAERRSHLPIPPKHNSLLRRGLSIFGFVSVQLAAKLPCTSLHLLHFVTFVELLLHTPRS